MNFLLGVLIIGPLLVILLIMATLQVALENCIMKAGDFYMNVITAIAKRNKRIVDKRKKRAAKTRGGKKE